MPRTDQPRALVDAVAGLAQVLEDFSRGDTDINHLIALRDEVMTHLRAVPGLFLVTPQGEATWERLVRSGADRESAESLAQDLAGALRAGRVGGDRIRFIDDTFTVVLDGTYIPVRRPLAYAVLKVLHAWRGEAVKPQDLVKHLDDPDLLRGRAREKFPVLDAESAGKRRISRAIDSLPPPLRALIRGGKNGRAFNLMD